MLEIKQIREQIKKNKDNKPIVVIDSGIRGRQNAAALFELSKETEWEFFQDGYFLAEDLESLRSLSERALEKIEIIKALEPFAIIIASDRITKRVQNKIAAELTGFNVISSEIKPLKKMPIVVVDSGVGGMKIAKEIHTRKPTENVILIADNKFLPYGNQDKRIISRRAVRIMAYIKNLDPKAVILGCNTLDSLAGDKIEAQLGSIPLIRIVNTTAKTAVKMSKTKSIGLIATKNTIDSQKYMFEMLGYYPNTHLLGLECPNLATAIERREDLKQVFKEEVTPLKDYEFDTLILGCTHYSNIIPLVKKEFPNTEIIDSANVVTDEFINVLENKLQYNIADKGSVTLITTQRDDYFDQNVNRFFGDEEVTVEEETIN